jgi:hypothetical protein
MNPPTVLALGGSDGSLTSIAAEVVAIQGYYRLGNAQLVRQNWAEAAQAFYTGLEISPDRCVMAVFTVRVCVRVRDACLVALVVASAFSQSEAGWVMRCAVQQGDEGEDGAGGRGGRRDA